MGKLLVLMITAFVDMVGLLMVVPLLPFYAERFGASATMVGVLVAAFSVAQLLSAPIWGRVSDRYGRRPALLVGLGAAAVAYVIFAFANSVWLLLLSRVVQGAGGGTVGVVQAYVADATAPKDRARSLGWLSASTSVGVTLGPALGSFSLRLGHAAPGLFAAALCLLNMAFAWRYLVESYDVAAARTATPRPHRSREAVWSVISHAGEPSSRLIWIYTLAMGAFQVMTSMLALLLADRWHVTEDSIGYFFAYVGAISVVTRALVLGWMVDHLGEARLSRLGLLLLGLGLGSLPLAHSYPVLAVSVALIPLGTAFTFPCTTAMLSQVISKRERGLYMGLQQTYGGVARSVAPVLAGWAFGNLGEGVPFYVAAVVVWATIFLGIGLGDVVRAHREREALEEAEARVPPAPGTEAAGAGAE